MMMKAQEPFLNKRALANHLSCSVRWVEHRMAEGLPHYLIAGRVKFRASEAEAWLRQEGFIQPGGQHGAQAVAGSGVSGS